MVATKAPIQPSSEVHEAANTRFAELLPELKSRCRRLASRYPKNMRRDVADDAINAAFLNFSSAYARGKRLSAGELAYFVQFHIRCRSLITQLAYPSRVRRRLVRLDDVTSDLLGRALATDERDGPAELARVRLDWTAFSNTQSRRHRKILLRLAVGDSKSGIARRLGISCGRVSQLLDDLGREVSAFFGGDVGVSSAARRAARCGAG